MIVNCWRKETEEECIRVTPGVAFNMLLCKKATVQAAILVTVRPKGQILPCFSQCRIRIIGVTNTSK